MADSVDTPSPRTAPSTTHQSRFVVAFVALAIVLAAAVGLTVWLLLDGKPAPWTDHPIPSIDDPVERAEAVATLVEGRYLDDSGAPLTRISAGEDLTAEAPGANQVVAVHADPDGPPLSFEYGNLVFFRLCASGPECAYNPAPRALPQRVIGLTARQARELALRGLKNVPEAEYALILMPNGILESDTGSAPPTVGFYYRRKDLTDQLSDPLPPDYDGEQPTPGTITGRQAAAMFETYIPNLYTVDGPTPSPDGASLVYELFPAPTE